MTGNPRKGRSDDGVSNFHMYFPLLWTEESRSSTGARFTSGVQSRNMLFKTDILCITVGAFLIVIFICIDSGYSGKEIKLVSERIKALDIENPTPAEIHHDSDSGSESNSDAEQEFVSSVLQENLSNTKKLAGKPLKSILKKSPTKRAEPKLFTSEDTLDEASAQLNKGTSDVLQEEDGFPGNIQGGKPCHSQNVLENAQVSENLGNNSSCSQVVFLGVSQKGADQFKRLLAKSKLSVSPADSLAAKDSLLESLWQTFTEWRSEETLKLLHGSCSTSSHLLQHTQPNDSEKEELDEDDLENASSSEDVSQKHTLNSLDQSLPFQDSRTAAKPLPSFENLKKETIQLELKVSEFYKGKFTVIEEDDLAMQSEREQQNGKSQVSILKIKEVVIISTFRCWGQAEWSSSLEEYNMNLGSGCLLLFSIVF